VVDDQSRRGSLLGVEQLLEHSPELMMFPLPKSLGALVLEPSGDDAEYECSLLGAPA
jgi:hypothetical protein